jgi:tetratricopeptide (TPR) repeat protein
MFATALRISAVREMSGSAPDETLRIPRAAALAGVVAALVLIVVALGQNNVPYPENIRQPKTVAQARALIAAHPAEAAPHLELIRLAGGRLPESQWMAELHAAVWLDPTNPYARDAWAAALLEQGMKARALRDITRSVAASPNSSTHFYLTSRLVPWLSIAQQSAVERGFRRAIARRYTGAVSGLAGFYQSLDRFASAADVYRRAARLARAPRTRERYLLGAGAGYVRAGKLAAARRMFELAIRDEPGRTRAYECLVTTVLGPERQLDAARTIVAQGVRAGADGESLYTALAQAAESARDPRLAESALRAAVAARPSFGALVHLGIFYLNEGKYNHAALIMREAIENQPRSAKAYFYLGMAEERVYSFSAAARDLAHAVRLAPSDTAYQAQYAGFEHKLAQNLKNLPPLDE